MCNKIDWQNFILNCNLIINCTDKIYNKKDLSSLQSITEINLYEKNKEQIKTILGGNILRCIYDNFDNNTSLSNLYSQEDHTNLTSFIINECAADLKKITNWEIFLESTKLIIKCVDEIYANPEIKSLLTAIKIDVHEVNVEEARIELNGKILKFIWENLANDEYCAKVYNQGDTFNLIQHITSQYAEHLKKIANWQNFISNNSSENLLSLIKECAKQIYKNPNIRTLLRHIEIDIYESNLDSVITELAGYIFIFIRDNLEDNIHFADLYNQGNHTMLVQNLKRVFAIELSEIARNKDYYKNYYRRCRESFSKSNMIVCRRIIDTNGRDLGISFAPATKANAPDALGHLFSFDEYRTIPPPPKMLQKNINSSKHIVKAGIFFWCNAAKIKGKYFILLQEFVNYIKEYFDLSITIQPPPGQNENEEDSSPRDQIIPDSDPDTGPSIHNLSLAEYFEFHLTELEMNVLCRLYTEHDRHDRRQMIMEKFGLSEYKYKKVLNNIQKVWKSFYEKR